jgi:CHAD domain-containing protein
MVTHSMATKQRYADGLTPADPLLALASNIFKREAESLREHLRPQTGIPDPEEIHQARIAVRRLRVALRAFRGFMPAQAEEFRPEFRWLGQVLGEARDLDVYAESLRASGAGTAATRAKIEKSLERSRSAAYDHLRALLASQRYARLMTTFGDFVATEPPPGVQRRWRSLRIRDAVRGDLRESLKRVLKLGRKVDGDSPPEKLHKLRIRAKRLRYESEFYMDFYPELRDLMRGTKHLQDLLGSYRDACNAADRLRDLARRSKSSKPGKAALAPLIRALTESAAEVRRGFPAAWRRFEKVADAAKLGR